MTELILVAASGLAREVIASIHGGESYSIRGYLDDDPALAGTAPDGVPVLGRIDDAAAFPEEKFVVCAGKGASREGIVRRLEDLGVGADRYARVIDRTAVVSDSSVIGLGSILLANVVLTAGVRLGEHVVAMPQVTFTHDNQVADFATLTAGVSLGGGVRIGRGAYLGMNASVREECSIGAGATVGMGAAVVQDVPDGETWVGVPARLMNPPGTARRVPVDMEGKA
ncbi:acetyltransferase [Arthrobacter livingstonensis]|uniref:Acetyltransferase n=1 Tax=Arthrobacter livingstonensis TaxID=670078 RepID=A0A2V5M072_9MICC|nr:acetyltransferase [Arthrobacter livingstonensis]PYI68366.1 acetyltransferase [Arthrobacter livingstonensis]